MKKIIIVLALIASVQVANAQGNAGAAKKAIEAAVAATQNEKKAAKVTTWTKLAETYMNAYNVPAGNVWVGANETELKLAMGSEKPSAVENVVLGGAQYVKQVYDNKNLYFNANGQLEVIEVTKPVVENALDKALEAYKKAYEVDPKGSKTKDIAAGIKTIAEKYNQDAYNAYTLGNVDLAGKLFEKAFSASSTKPCEKIDTSSLYNAAFTAWSVKDYAKAKPLLDRCLDLGYYADNGEVYAKIAECVEKSDTTAAGKKLAKEYLEKGFSKFPQSQSIMIGLINYYVTSGDDTDRLFALIDEAKKNEPTNASLYYVEGNVRAQLHQYDEAVKAYEKCAEINPAYEYGYIGEGLMYYNQAADIVEKAQNEFDDAKYMALIQQFEVAFKSCIDPFEKAFEITKDESLKASIAEYLKNVFFRFRDEDPKFQAGYDKYNGFLSK